MHDLSKRFGNLIGGAQDVKNHRYFSKIDFTAVKNMAWHDVPYVPPPAKISLETLSKRQGLKLTNLAENAKEVSAENDIFKRWF
jgi:hypothetical protein